MFEHMRRRLRFWSQACDKIVAPLQKKDLSDADRRGLILVLRSMFQLRRQLLRNAEFFGAMPPAELTKLNAEFRRAALGVCEGQEVAICARLDSSELSVRKRCALIRTYCTLLTMIQCLERGQERPRRKGQASMGRWARN